MVAVNRARAVVVVLAGSFALIMAAGATGPGRAVAQPTGTMMLDESFSGDIVSNPAITGIGSTCLSAATVGTAQFPTCATHLAGPVPTPGLQPGYLQLTDASMNKSGAVFLNQLVPSSAGVEATFDLFQYGGGADGVSFFLVNGATELTRPELPAAGWATPYGTRGQRWSRG